MLGQTKLSHNQHIKKLVENREARLHKHQGRDMKTFFTQEEKKAIFEGKKEAARARAMQAGKA